MTEVQVPVYRDGKTQMVPKYKYSDIASGEINTVVNNALTGLVTPSQGKKYLLHTHPDNTGYVQDYFSGLPNDLLNMGDASIPTLAGSQWYQLPQLLNGILTGAESAGNPLVSAALQVLQNVTGKQLSGYDGIYLASPNGYLTLYQGKDDESGKLVGAAKPANAPIQGVTIPETKGRWDDKTGKYVYKK